MVYVPDNGGGVLVNDEGVFVFRVFQIPVRGKSPDELTPAAFGVKGAADVGAGFGGVAVIHQAVDGDFHALGTIRVGIGVHMGIADSDKAAVVGGKKLLYEPALVAIVSKAAGKGLANHAVHFPRLYVAHHALKVRAGVLGGAGAAIIHIEVYQNVIFIPKLIFYKFKNDFALVGDAQGFIVAVILGQPDIDRNSPDDVLLSGGLCGNG